MAYPKHVWDQIKNVTAEELVRALKKDGWKEDASGGSIAVYTKKGESVRRVSIHWKPGKTYGRRMLNDLLEDIGWTEEDLKRLKLIRK